MKQKITLCFIVVILITIFGIIGICHKNDNKNEDLNLEWYQEANKFKYECLEHQDSLIVLYQQALKDVQIDEELQDLIDEQEEVLDSLYSTQL